MIFHAKWARRAALLGGFASLLSFTASVQAAGYPERPVTLVVAFPPGGPSDVLARIVGKKMEELLGQPFVIENKPGRRRQYRGRFRRACDTPTATRC